MLKLSIDSLKLINGGATCVDLALQIGASGGLTGIIQNTDLKAQLKANGSNYGQYVVETKALASECGFPPSFLETGAVPPGQQ